MRNNGLLSAVHFFIVLFFLFIGGGLFLLAERASMRASLAHLLTYHPESIVLSGSIFLSMGLFLLIGFYALYRGSYYVLKFSPHKVFINRTVIQEYVELYWKSLNLSSHVKEVVIHPSQEIEVIVLGKEYSFTQEQIEDMEKALSSLLLKHLKYDRVFRLTLAVS